MNNPFDEMRAALAAAGETQKAADQHATQCAMLVTGRLRHVSPYMLKDLKRELADFNAHTMRWKK